MTIFPKIINLSFLSLFKRFASVGVISCLLLFNCTPVFADVWNKWESFSEDYKDNEGVEDYVWKEGSKQLPDYPQDKDLLEISGPPSYRNYQYLIDGKNLSVGADGVVRYSIVIRSPSGSDNVMFDGIRCSKRHMKNYAYGTTDMEGKKKFIQRENPVWKPFRSSGVTGYGPILARNYFCNFESTILTRHEIIQNIKYGKGRVDGLYIN